MDQLNESFNCQFYRIALAGGGQPLLAALEMFTDNGKRSPPQFVQIAGVIPETDADAGLAKSYGVATYRAVKDLAAAHPELNMVFCLSEAPERNDAVAKALADSLAGAITVVDLATARLLAQMCNGEEDSSNSDPFAARALFRAIMDEISEDILLLDLEGRVVDMNRRSYESRGLNKDDIIGKRCWELETRGFCCDQKENDQICPYRQTLQSKQKTDSVHSMVDSDGRMSYYRVYTYPVFNHKEDMTHIVEVRRDITSRMNMEFRLQQSEKMAAIGELATYIAHEIRNPLFSIGGFANALLRSSSLDDNTREKAAIILEESRRLDKILKSILNFARPTTAAEGAVDINTLVVETMDLMGIGCEQKGVTIKLETSPDIARVKADAELIKQALINMVKNAIEAMPDGGVLTVRTAQTSTYVVLEVEDTGHGIEEDIREKVFNPFFSTKDQGAGLGLAMTKKIVEDMGGKVELVSHVNQGCLITISLPPVMAVEDGE